MTLDEALAELGIDHAAGSDGARRAYLRLLKTRKPETDQAGFMRLREAYERVKSDLVFRESVLRGASGLETLPRAEWTPDPLPTPKPPADADADADTDTDTGTDADADTGTDADADTGTDADADADTDADTGTDADADADADEEDTDDDDDDAQSIGALMRAGEYRRAAAAMSALYQEAAKRIVGPAPPVREALLMMLTLHSKGAPGAASTLLKSFAVWLAASGQEARLLRGELAVLWTLVRELAALPLSLPDPVRSAIARAALSGDLALARSDLASFRAHSRLTALSAVGLLRQHAPTIAAALAETLAHPPPSPPRQRYVDPTAPRSKSGWWMIMVAMLGVLRLIGAITHSASSPSYDPPSWSPSKYALPTAPPLQEFDGGFVLATRLDLLRSTAISRAYTVESKAALEYPYLSKKATEVASALQEQNCGIARIAAKTLSDMAKRNLKKPGTEMLETDVALLSIGVRDYCAALGDGGAPARPRAGSQEKP